MAIPKGARTGLLLFITAGPFLVFLFLYIFGKNHFELDVYPVKRSDVFQYFGNEPEALLFIDDQFDRDKYSLREFESQQRRLKVFWEKIGSAPVISSIVRQDTSFQQESRIRNGLIDKKSEFWLEVDTVLPLISAKGPITKRLPTPPRAFLFDKNQNLRGVYGLCNSMSVDTLMLEYKILTDK